MSATGEDLPPVPGAQQIWHSNCQTVPRQAHSKRLFGLGLCSSACLTGAAVFKPESSWPQQTVDKTKLSERWSHSCRDTLAADHAEKKPALVLFPAVTRVGGAHHMTPALGQQLGLFCTVLATIGYTLQHGCSLQGSCLS